MEILHLPRSVMQRHRAPSDDMAPVLAMVNSISRARYGCPADCLPAEIKELLLDHIAELLARLDAPEGMAS